MKQGALFILLLIAVAGQAQQDKVLQIRQHYSDIKNKILAMNTDSASPSFYGDILIKNISGAQWRAIGIYADTVKVYYSDLMSAHLENGDSANALQYITQTAVYSDTKIVREWLFTNGNLSFYYENQKNSVQQEEFRFYFYNQKLIRYMQGGQIIGYDDDPKPILDEAQKLKHWFINSFIPSL